MDLGTSGVRAVAFDQGLRVLAQAARPYGMVVAPNGAAEQDARQVAEAAEAAVAEVVAKLAGGPRIAALALCGTASSLAAFGPTDGLGRTQGDGSGSFVPLTPAWLWADVRAAAEAAEIRERFGNVPYQRTGCPVHASYWPAKLLNWRRQGRLPGHPAILAGIKDYVLYRLTGEWLVDSAVAAATGLFDSDHGIWDGELLNWLGIGQAQLPRVVSPAQRLPLTASAADRLGLPRKTEIVVGSLDGVLAHLGLGCERAGLASCMVGTSGAVRFTLPKRSLDTAGRTWCYPAPGGAWVAGGAVNNGGNVLTWLGGLIEELMASSTGPCRRSEAGTLASMEWPDRLVRLAMRAPAGANGLLFLPYVYGERSPLWREDVRGALIGLGPAHGAPELARAVLEGLSLGLYAVYRALVAQAGPASEVRASGGFVASEPWVQLQADVFGTPVVVTDQSQPTAAGAAMVAWYAVGGASLAELAAGVRVTRVFEPNPRRHAQYEALMRQVERLRDAVWPGGGPAR
ncbi:MAG: FGGY-family carbohydrate kinase [Bacillota bacterium]